MFVVITIISTPTFTIPLATKIFEFQALKIALPDSHINANEKWKNSIVCVPKAAT